MAIAAGYLVVAGWIGHATADFTHLVPTVRAITHSDLGGAYPAEESATSPPGYPILAAPAVAVLERFDGVNLERAYAWVGLTTPLWLAAAAMAAAWALGVTAYSWRLLATGAAVLIAPGVPHAVLGHVGGDIGIFHPQDVAATAAVLAALAAAARNRWLLAGLFLGAAVATRQWALVAAIPMVVAVPAEWRVRFTGAAAALATAAILPFLLADPGGTASALAARHIISNDLSAVGNLDLSGRPIFAVARAGPVFGALLIGAVAAWRWQRQEVDMRSLLATVTACIALRTVCDSAFFAYYLIPLSALVVVLTFSGRAPAYAGAAWLVAMALVTSTSPVDGPLVALPYALALLAASVSAFVWGLAILAKSSAFHQAVFSQS